MFHDVFRCGEITINVGDATRVPLITEKATSWFKTLFRRCLGAAAWQMPSERPASRGLVNCGIQLSGGLLKSGADSENISPMLGTSRSYRHSFCEDGIHAESEDSPGKGHAV